MSDLPINLKLLGWTPFFSQAFEPWQKKFEAGRIATEGKNFYTVVTAKGVFTGHVTGKLLHTVHSSAELPKVGDWVVSHPLVREGKAAIHYVLPRTTQLSRKVPGHEMQQQVLATNIDWGCAVQALDASFNLDLLHRHLLIINESGAKPVVVLNKADLCSDLLQKLEQARAVAVAAPILIVCAKTNTGVEQIANLIKPGQTAVFLGASGVGKSTLINDLCGDERQATTEVRCRDAKGRHTTSRRELIQLPNGGLVIDTPGMRELQLWESAEGLRTTFLELEELAVSCHFRNCSHTVERRCAVLGAVHDGSISQDRYERYLSLRRELDQLNLARKSKQSLERKSPRGGGRRTVRPA